MLFCTPKNSAAQKRPNVDKSILFCAMFVPEYGYVRIQFLCTVTYPIAVDKKLGSVLARTFTYVNIVADY